MRKATGGGGGASFASTILALSPWGFWKLDETGTLTTATDYSGNARHGTYSGTGTTDGATAPFGATASGITLDGNGRIDLPDWTLGTNQKFTIVDCIGAIPSSPGYMHLLSADDNGGGNRRYQWRINTSRQLEFVPWAGASAGVAFPSAVALSDTGPNMVAIVVDPTLSDGAGKFKFYVNGSLEYTSSANGYADPGLGKPAIGSRSSQLQAEGFVGVRGPSALFTDALSAGDIAAIWAARNTP